LNSSPESRIPIARRGLSLVLSSPSGAGKTTLARRLLEADKNIRMSVSVTTRAPRNGEVHGVDYYFIDDIEFEKLKRGDELLEWAEVFGNFYGTPKAPVLEALQAGKDVLFDVDWQGTRQIKTQLPADIVSVFILPPDGRTLERRLKARNQDSEAAVARRMAAAAAEIAHWEEYDYVIVNAAVDESFRELSCILSGERLKRERQLGLDQFVANMLNDL
jgi:guanylate kinase